MGFQHLVVGDTVIRDFYGIMQPLVIESIEGNIMTVKGGWMFERDTGIEHDPELGFGSAFGITCSILVPSKP